jgi:thymidylate kinase
VSAGGCLVAVEGIDGSGKSTLAAELTRVLAGRGQHATLVDRRTAPGAAGGYPGSHLHALRQLIWEYPQGARTSLLGFGHWSRLLASWFAAVDHTVVRPALEGGGWVVADPWYYKFAARFALSVGLDDALALFAGTSTPGAVVWLDVAPEECASRRTDPRRTESGEWQGGEGFVRYQRAVRSQYVTLAAANGWCVVTAPDAHALVDKLCREALGTAKEAER